MAVVVDNAAIQAVQISVWKKAFISLKGAPLIPLFIIVAVSYTHLTLPTILRV